MLKKNQIHRFASERLKGHTVKSKKFQRCTSRNFEIYLGEAVASQDVYLVKKTKPYL